MAAAVVALAVLTAPAAAATGPTGLRATDVRASGATLTWTAPSGGRPVYGYTIVDVDSPYVNNGVGWSFASPGTADLEPSTTYHLAVVATFADTFTDSPRSNPITVTTPRDTAPPATPAIRSPWHTQTSVTVAFGGASDDVGVEDWIVSDGSRTWRFPAWQQWEHELTGLATNRTYTFTLRARDAAGNVSPASTPVSVLIESNPPTAPANLRVQNGVLRWDPASDDSGIIAGYTAFVDGVAYAGGSGLAAPLQVQDPVTMEPLPGPGPHTYVVRARDPSGNVSAPSNAVTAVVR